MPLDDLLVLEVRHRSRGGVIRCFTARAGRWPSSARSSGTLARCLQHETDHLNGVVMADHLTTEQHRQLRRDHRRVTDRYPREWPANQLAGED